MVRVGLRQGCPFTPILFMIFVDDVVLLASSSHDPQCLSGLSLRVKSIYGHKIWVVTE